MSDAPHIKALQHDSKWTRSETMAPLGLDQERLWLLQQLHPLSSTYNLSFGLHVRGTLRLDHLVKAVDRLVERHEILRSVVQQDEDGRPFCRISSSANVPVQFVDLRQESAIQGSDALRNEIDRSVRRPFDLQTGPVARMLVVQDQTDSYHLIWTAHHSVIDRWSFLQLNRELLGFYHEYAFGKLFVPDSVALPYFDFAVRQRNWLAENKDDLRGFWRNYLKGTPGRIALPYDRSPTSSDRAGAHYSFVVEDTTAHGAIAYARKNRMTLVTLVLGVYAALLFENTGQRDFVIGLPSVARGDPDTHTTVGFLLTNTPIRISIPETPTLASIIAETRRARMEVSGFEETPFGEIIDAVAPKRSADEYPLVQTMLLCVEFEEVLFDYQDGEISVVGVPIGVSPNDITLGFWKAGEHLHGRFEYRTALFFPDTIESMALRLLELLTELAMGRDQVPLWARAEPSGLWVDKSEATAVAETPGSADERIAGDPKREILANVWRKVLGTADVGASSDFFESGGNSFLVLRLVKGLRDHGYSLQVRDVFTDAAFRALAEMLIPIETNEASRSGVVRRAPASPEQVRFLESGARRPELWAHTCIFECRAGADAHRMKAAMATVVAAHPSLTARFSRDEHGWWMETGQVWSWEELDASIAHTAIVERHRSLLEMSTGPLVCATWLSGERPCLAVTASHLIVDGLSWTTFEQELASAYDGNLVEPETASSFDYSSALYRRSFLEEVPFWNKQLAGIQPLSCVLDGPNHFSGEKEQRHHLPFAATSHQYEAEVLTAIATALLPWYSPVVFDIVGLGREPLQRLPNWDPLRSIGNYGCLFPIRLEIAGASLTEDCAAVRQTLRTVPFGGKGYGVLRCGKNADLISDLPAISVNYMGHLRQLTSAHNSIFLARSDVGAYGENDAARSHLINIDVSVDGGITHAWRFNPRIVSEDGVRQVAEHTNRNLLALIDQSGIACKGGRVGLSQHEIDTYFSTLGAQARQAG